MARQEQPLAKKTLIPDIGEWCLNACMCECVLCENAETNLVLLYLELAVERYLIALRRLVRVAAYSVAQLLTIPRKVSPIASSILEA